MTLLGLTGTLGAGKGTVVEYLVKNKGFTYVSVSEFLASEAVARGREADRQARQDIANQFRAKGPTALMEAVYDSVDPLAARVVLEPQHTQAEVQFIQSKGGTVLGVDAELPLRYERIKKRGSAKDNVTFAEFSRIQEKELKSDDPNKNNLGAALMQANLSIQNNGTLGELHAEVDRALAKLGIA